MKKRVNFFFYITLILSCLYSVPGFSTATCVPQGDYSVTPQNIIIQRDVPVGTELSRIEGSTKTMWLCTGQTTYHAVVLSGTNAHPTIIDGKTIFSTNLDGVGYALGGALDNLSFTYAANGSDTVYSWYTTGLLNGGTVTTRVTIIFYKTGAISSGEVTTPIYGKFTPSMNADDNNGGDLNLVGSAFKVTALACSITTPTLNFVLGNVPASNFAATIGPVPDLAENTQNLGLNCDADANINVSLNGIQNPDIADTSVLGLTGQGDAGVAQGVGVQLVYNGTPLELNKIIVLKKSTGGQETFPIVARYYQTKTTVMPGKANTSATLNITYQ